MGLLRKVVLVLLQSMGANRVSSEKLLLKAAGCYNSCRRHGVLQGGAVVRHAGLKRIQRSKPSYKETQWSCTQRQSQTGAGNSQSKKPRKALSRADVGVEEAMNKCNSISAGLTIAATELRNCPRVDSFRKTPLLASQHPSLKESRSS